MKKSTINIIIILIVIVLLPGVIFSVYQFGSLKRNEQIISDIYNNQLETVLNSVNQYSDDILRSWAEEINLSLYANEIDRNSKLQNFLSLNYQVKAIIFSDSTLEDLSIISSFSSESQEFKKDSLRTILLDNVTTTKRLQSFLQTGYRKIELLQYNDQTRRSLFIFAIKMPETNVRLCAIIIETEQFIRDILGPRMQVLTRDQVVLSAFHGNGDEEVYVSDIYQQKRKLELLKPLWLLPDYTLGISMKGETIKEMARRRSRMNIILILILDTIMLVALFFLYRSVKREMQLVQLKSDFISNVSHEIRTPLSLINMFIETLEMKRVKTEEKKMEYYRMINQETKRLSGIVNKILNFSRIESGRKRYRKEIANLNTVTNNVLDVYKYHLNNEGFEFSFQPDKQLPDILIDPDAISDAIINLLDNAIKYSEQDKYIELITGTYNNEAYIELRDRGIGIPLAEQTLIFEKFYRIKEGSLAFSSKGTGLGLSIIKHIMDAHNGKATIKSEVNKGSAFRLSFPILNK